MPFDDSLIQDVINHADIVKVISSYLNVIKKGKGSWAVCPFHDDTKPSLSISPNKKIFKCFACGTSGNAITFVQKYEHISFSEALKKVADISGYDDPRLHGLVKPRTVDNKKEALLKCLHDLTTYYQYALNTVEGKEGVEYLNQRNLGPEIRTKYLLGYAFKDGANTIKYLQSKGNSLQTIEDTGIATLISGGYSDVNRGRVIFPICDQDGNVIGYSARRIRDNDDAKYVNSPETYLFHKSNVLYNYHIAKTKAPIAKYIYVCEGFMDVFALGKIGIDSAVALMGTALTEEHIAMLRKLNVEIRLCLDGDFAGQSAMMKACAKLQAAGLPFRIVDNQNSTKDPDEIINQDGPDALRNYVEKLVGRIDFALNYYQNSNPLKTIEQRKALVKEFIPILLSIKDNLELDSYIRRLSKVTSFEIDSIKGLLKEARKNVSTHQDEQVAEQVIKEFHPERKALRRLEMAERELLYQMVNNGSAVAFYEEKVDGFYNDVYRKVANYLIDYVKTNKDVNVSELMTAIEMSDVEDKDELMNELATISLETTHPNKCTPELLENLLNSINEEKERITDKDELELSLKGKSDIEKARIIAEYNRRKMKKMKQ